MPEAGADPLVSVIVCVFNGEEFLRPALDSVFAQTYERFELIVVDDGSTDASVAVSAAYQDPRVRLIRQKNLGAAAALAAGLEVARGEYIAFLDQDDLWEKEKLAVHVNWLERRPQVDLTFSWFRYVNETGRDIGIRSNRYRGTIDFRGLLADFVIGATSNVVTRRAAIEKVGGVDPAFPRVYDFDLFLRIAMLAPHNVEAVPQDLMLYRRHVSQISRDFEVVELEWERVVEKLSRLAPADVAAVVDRARLNVRRYLARLAYEQSGYRQAWRYVARGFWDSPGWFLADPRNWLTTAACLSAVVLPHPLHRRLERLVGLDRD